MIIGPHAPESLLRNLGPSLVLLVPQSTEFDLLLYVCGESVDLAI